MTTKRLHESSDVVNAVPQVWLLLPQCDADAVAKAQALAELVKAELATLELETDFDQLIRDSRGRTWSP